MYLYRGPRVRVGEVQITGTEVLSSAEVRRLFETHEGRPFDPQTFTADVQALLDRYEEHGHPLAQVHVTRSVVDTTEAPRLYLSLDVAEGPRLWLKRIEVPEGARTSPGLIARLAGLSVGDVLAEYDPEAIQSALQESDLFRSVEVPTMTVTSDGGAILRIPVEEAAPGAFDLAIGYLPPSEGRNGGQIVGSGHLLLEHLFGGGRQVDLSLDRRPGQASIFDLSLADPYVFGFPFRVEGRFRGEQRDSTYGKRTYRLDVGYQLRRDFTVSGRVSREVVKPGQAGVRLRDGRQRIPRSQTLFYGVGVQYVSIDRADNPRRGVRVDVHVDQGRKQRSRQQVSAGGDTTRSRASLRQERFQGTVRVYVPLFNRQVFVVGGDGSVLRSRAYDRSDLFRFGGAQSLRGYDEDRFLGNVTVRGLLEYRVQLDRQSYVYAFGDLGYVERPSLGDRPATQDWRPGYGFGIQVRTGIGLISTTYALNPEVQTPMGGRLHFGLSVGL
jgi:outer membrane protein assembly factor BamA